MTSAFVQVTGVSKSFASGSRRRDVLRNVSLDVARGEFVSLVGAMGTGKSTLLAMIAGLLMPEAGTVTIAGEPVIGVRRDTSIVFQNYSLLPWLTALENVRLALESAFPTLTRQEHRARAHRALEQVGLGHAVSRRPAQLSGGMRQRVAIARALSVEPALLLLDDPFGALDAMTRGALQQELAGLGSAGARDVTTVMITNNLDEAILLSDRIVPVLPGPPATLGSPVVVALPRPRPIDALQHDDAAVQMRTRVMAALTEALARAS